MCLNPVSSLSHVVHIVIVRACSSSPAISTSRKHFLPRLLPHSQQRDAFQSTARNEDAFHCSDVIDARGGTTPSTYQIALATQASERIASLVSLSVLATRKTHPIVPQHSSITSGALRQIRDNKCIADRGGGGKGLGRAA